MGLGGEGEGLMAHVTHVQLIEKISLPTQVWLTFWDLDERVQLSLEIGSPVSTYRVGEVFQLDRDARLESLALTPAKRTEFDISQLIIPLPTEAETPSKRTRRRLPAEMITVERTPSDKVRAPVSLLMIDRAIRAEHVWGARASF